MSFVLAWEVIVLIERARDVSCPSQSITRGEAFEMHLPDNRRPFLPQREIIGRPELSAS